MDGKALSVVGRAQTLIVLSVSASTALVFALMATANGWTMPGIRFAESVQFIAVVAYMLQLAISAEVYRRTTVLLREVDTFRAKQFDAAEGA